MSAPIKHEFYKQTKKVMLHVYIQESKQNKEKRGGIIY
jgi:hypothetical protein